MKTENDKKTGSQQQPIYPTGGFPGQVPMMMPYYYPNMGYFMQPQNPQMMQPYQGQINPFGVSQWSIPQLNGPEGPINSQTFRPSREPAPVEEQRRRKRRGDSKEEYIETFYEEVFPRLGNKGLIRLQKVAFI